MYRPLFACGLSLAVMFNSLSAVSADETRVDVRVISKGAKFIGTSMGGAEITINDADTGQLLAVGKTTGSTGDTRKIMQQRLHHHASVATEDAAVFQATLALDEPRRIRVTARGPLAQRQATATAAVTHWVVPGKHITGGDALRLELPGFVVDILHPPAHQQLSQPTETIELNANVTMMCGCPIEPDGLWDANQFEVAAIIKRNGKRVDEVPLQYAGATSQFTAKLKASEPGVYEITVYAYDPANGNTGVDKTTIVVSAP
jgi:hypothetical protein